MKSNGKVFQGLVSLGKRIKKKMGRKLRRRRKVSIRKRKKVRSSRKMPF